MTRIFASRAIRVFADAGTDAEIDALCTRLESVLWDKVEVLVAQAAADLGLRVELED